jgi:hypothetical protein
MLAKRGKLSTAYLLTKLTLNKPADLNIFDLEGQLYCGSFFFHGGLVEESLNQ